MQQPAPRVSFVIPAYNEERFIATTLASIDRAAAGRWGYEIIVVDNGSSDRTVELARQGGARTFVVKDTTVAGLRNFGAAHSAGAVLVFLDADVVLEADWARHIDAALDQLTVTPELVTGSVCGVPKNASWLERNWFGPLQNGRNTHINSGHLVITRSFFERLRGFDTTLETGEDYELSMRAIRAGGEIRNDPRLAVVHLGYPRTASAFVRREMWHGRGDFDSVRSLVQSPIALATLLFLGAHIVLVVALFTGATLGALLSAAVIALMCLGASVRQYKHSSLAIVSANAAVYYLYFVGRVLALLMTRPGATTFVHRDNR